jgi:chromosome segregation ATPase
VAFSVQDFHDLVRLLEERPEWRTELRRLVLSEELLCLPDVVAGLAEAQQRAEERLSGVEERLSRVEERVTRLEVAVTELAEAQRRTELAVRELAEAQRRSEGRLDRLEDHIAALRGDSLERWYREHASGYFGRLIRRGRVVEPGSAA